MKDNENRTLEQLEVEFENAKKAYELAQKNLTQKKTEEADRKKAELAATKEARRKEIEEVENKLDALYKAYLKDYGSIEINRSTDDDNLFSTFLKRPWLLL